MENIKNELERGRNLLRNYDEELEKREDNVIRVKCEKLKKDIEKKESDISKLESDNIRYIDTYNNLQCKLQNDYDNILEEESFKELCKLVENSKIEVINHMIKLLNQSNEIAYGNITNGSLGLADCFYSLLAPYLETITIYDNKDPLLMLFISIFFVQMKIPLEANSIKNYNLLFTRIYNRPNELTISELNNLIMIIYDDYYKTNCFSLIVIDKTSQAGKVLLNYYYNSNQSVECLRNDWINYLQNLFYEYQVETKAIEVAENEQTYNKYTNIYMIAALVRTIFIQGNLNDKAVRIDYIDINNYEESLNNTIKNLSKLNIPEKSEHDYSNASTFLVLQKDLEAQ